MTKRGIFGVCLTLCVFAAMICLTAVTASAAVTVSEPSYDESAGGYQISNLEELYWFAGLVNGTLSGGTAQNTAASAVLTADITINENVIDETGALNPGTFEEWIPIGDYAAYSAKYSGTFDGAGYAISGLYVVRESNYVGMFGYVTGTVKNLTISDSYVSGISYVGGAVGYSTGVIQSVSVADTLVVSSTGSSVGGVCGIITGTNVIGGTSTAASVDGCSFGGSVVGGKSYTGGIVGQAGSNCTVTNSFNTGSVTGGTSTYTGGVLGGAAGGNTVTDCYNLGSVASGGGDRIGGVCGYISKTTMERCYNAGEVTGDVTYVGAIAGYVNTASGFFGGSSTITSCYYVDTMSSSTGNTTTNLTETNVESKTTDAFNSGEVAWLLQGDEETLVWGQSLLGENVDEYPILSDDESVKVIKITFIYTDESTTEAYTNYSCVLTDYPTSESVDYTFYTDAEYTDKIDTEEYTYTADMSLYVAEGKKLGVTLIDGAQIRIGAGVTEDDRTGSGSGLRFIAKINRTGSRVLDAVGTDDEIGIVISADKTPDKDDAYVKAKKYQDGTDESVFTVAITDIDPSNYNTVYYAIPYVKVDGEYYYGDYVARTPYQVAKGLLVDNKKTDGYNQTATSETLINVLNAYANETGARIELTYSASDGFGIAEASYANGATAFFEAECEDIKDDSGAVIGAKITLTGKNEDVAFYGYWTEYIRINNNHKTAVTHIDADNAKIEKDADGKSTLTFEFYLDSVTQ